MKLNIAYPATGCQKLIEVDDEKKYRVFYEKRMAQEVEADSLGEEWKVGAILKFISLIFYRAIFCASLAAMTNKDFQ